MKRTLTFIALILCMMLLCSCVMENSQMTVTDPSDSSAASQVDSPVPEVDNITEDPQTSTITTTSEPTNETESEIATEPSTTVLESEQEPQTEPPYNSTFEIHFIDVGQADSALVLCDDEAMLIDGGNAADSSLIYSYLKNHGVSHLDYMICTHPHEDHVGGLSGALNYATVGTAFCSMKDYDTKTFSNFKNYLDKQEKQIQVPSAGSSFTLGSSTVTVLGPVSYYSDPNNMSIVLRIEYGNTSFLFAGDAEIDSEQDILNTGVDLNSTVLKVGHHGSDTSTSYRWLREIAPQYAIISVGEDNSYGHPTEQTLSRLSDADVTLFRTDLQGHIICTSDGNTVSFTVQRNANADTFYIEPPATVPTERQTEATAASTSGSDANKTSYVLNTNTKKFHYPSCSSVKQMADKNRKDITATREEVIAMGYDSCGRCNP